MMHGSIARSKMIVFLFALLLLGCAEAVKLPTVYEPIGSEEWKRCSGELAERESVTMIDDLTLDSKTLLCKGVVLAAAGDVNKGLELLAEAAIRDKKDHRPCYLAGRILAENRRYEESLTEFERSHQRFPSIDVPAERIGRELINDGKEGDAKSFLMKAFDRNLCSYGCKGLLAKLHHKTGEDDKARALYEKMIEEDPADPTAFVGLAGMENSAANYKKESEYLEKAKYSGKFKDQSFERRADILYSLAFAKYNASEYTEAAAAIKEAISLNGKQADWYVLAGWIDLKRNRPETALESFQNAKSMNAGLAAAHTGEGDAKMALGDREAAIKAYETARNLDPTNSVIVLKLAFVFAASNKPDDAKRMLDEAVKIDKDHLPQDLLKKVTDLLKE